MKFCNHCGAPILHTFNRGVSIRYMFGWGSNYDGDEFSADFCPECTDKILTDIAVKCNINPIIGRDDCPDELYSLGSDGTVHIDKYGAGVPIPS